jgi:hypothetical protein
MLCFNNKKRFLFLSWKGQHSMKVVSASVFMPGAVRFMVEFKCEKCGSTFKQHFVEWNEMLRLGFTNEQLEDIRWHLFGWRKEAKK